MYPNQIIIKTYQFDYLLIGEVFLYMIYYKKETMLEVLQEKKHLMEKVIEYTTDNNITDEDSKNDDASKNTIPIILACMIGIIITFPMFLSNSFSNSPCSWLLCKPIN